MHTVSRRLGIPSVAQCRRYYHDHEPEGRSRLRASPKKKKPPEKVEFGRKLHPTKSTAAENTTTPPLAHRSTWPPKCSPFSPSGCPRAPRLSRQNKSTGTRSHPRSASTLRNN